MIALTVLFYVFFLFETEVLAKSYNLPKPIDLSHTVDEKTITWDKDTPFVVTNQIAKNLSDASFYASNDFCIPEHAGTHLDAPYHFAKEGLKVADIPLDTLIAPGVIVNVSDIAEKNGSDFLLQVKHLETWGKKYGELPTDAILLINFGWSCRYSNRTLYFGAQSPPYSFPGISEGAAEWIVKSGRIRGIGVDTPSVDYGKSVSYSVHKLVYKAGLFGVENVDLCNKNLPVKGFDLIVLPMKIGGGTGAPVRIVAI